MGLFGKRAPAVDPDAHIGKTSAEILALPQLQIQFACIVLVHVLAYVAFSRKDSYFHSRPNIIAHYIPRGSGARALRARALRRRPWPRGVARRARAPAGSC
ncbi:glycosyltransferase [Aureococcus anophagefferens]|nr:glycosyltransferase [Aureococcus anophagefferens]